MQFNEQVRGWELQLFDEQLREWEVEFLQWKETNANHPDQLHLKMYESKFGEIRRQLLEVKFTNRVLMHNFWPCLLCSAEKNLPRKVTRTRSLVKLQKKLNLANFGQLKMICHQLQMLKGPCLIVISLRMFPSRVSAILLQHCSGAVVQRPVCRKQFQVWTCHNLFYGKLNLLINHHSKKFPLRFLLSLLRSQTSNLPSVPKLSKISRRFSTNLEDQLVLKEF